MYFSELALISAQISIESIPLRMIYSYISFSPGFATLVFANTSVWRTYFGSLLCRRCTDASMLAQLFKYTFSNKIFEVPMPNSFWHPQLYWTWLNQTSATMSGTKVSSKLYLAAVFNTLFSVFFLKKNLRKVLVIEVVHPLNSKGMLLLFRASSSLMLNCP